MVFAYILSITVGLILGSFQLFRKVIISDLGGGFEAGPLTDLERAVSRSSFFLLVFGCAAFAAIFVADPWVIVDNFVTGKETPLIVQFSILKLLVFAASVIIGEILVGYYHEWESSENHDWREACKKRRASYEYKSNMEDWVKWRRQTANSAHPDWTPPKDDDIPNNFQNSFEDTVRSNKLVILGLKNGASEKEIHKKYLKLAKQHHPDLVTSADKEHAERKMKDINAAYDWLKSNP